jgi:hypothetical protein
MSFGVWVNVENKPRTIAFESAMAASMPGGAPGCPFRKLCPDVMVVQSGQDRDGDNSTGALDRPTQGRILAQCQVRADLIVVRCISRKNLPQVRRTKDQHPVQALAA